MPLAKSKAKDTPRGNFPTLQLQDHHLVTQEGLAATGRHYPRDYQVGSY